MKRLQSDITKGAKMNTTMELFQQALTVEPSAKAWCDELGVSRNTLAVAKIRGRLSPALAGGIAMKLGESPEHWIAVAALEAEPESTLLQRLRKSQASWRKR
ncbi:hypothetical protein [Rhodoferax ferrireducens]|uniref:hypothetical protein n=1 Tax=Rhodoferax ferrireducens TaxID=192843 RepID=UPI0018E55390|nr:hypothetical protein [Rhodoferax ferrireducens]